MRLLDVGCGWGGMVMHAAREYGVQALGVTLSREQADWAQEAIVERRGSRDLAEVRPWTTATRRRASSTRSVRSGSPSTSAWGNLTSYFAFLHARLRPGGRLLNHCITRARHRRSGRRFIDRYVFPDGQLEAVGRSRPR